jgi:hypothetical protein
MSSSKKSSMKSLLAPIVLLVAVPLPAFGTIYEGSLTETITDTGGSPLYHDGETFTGFYEYDSPTVDGNFFNSDAASFNPPAGTNETLDGVMYVPFPWDPVFVDDGFGTNVYAELVVSAGEVNSFFWQLDNGGIFSVFSADSFFSFSYAEDNPNFPLGIDPPITVSGTVSFGAPGVVPDSTATIWPVALGVVLCSSLFVRTQKRLGAKQLYC